jgi:MFS family permease
MRKINFTQDVLPHIIAVLVFLVVTFFFFSPVFFEGKVLGQHDIQQFQGSSKTIADYRTATGEEGLWASNMFSGMPAYLVSLKWSEGPLAWTKKVMAIFLPHPVASIFIAFICYYILLLSFRVRPYLAMAGALAFGLSSYMIIGLVAGHNARIGAIAFMPLIIAGIHLAFTGKRILGFALTALGLSLQLRENHLQITYYIALVVAVYGLVQLIYAYREKQLPEFFKSLVILIPAALLAVGTFFGQFWAVTEYTTYSSRGPSELVKPGQTKIPEGSGKSWAFEYSDGIAEPLALIIPNIYGGNVGNYLIQDEKSEVYKALMANARSNEEANQLAGYTSAYFGRQGAPYYGGAIICFLFVLGILFAEKKYVWWLVPLSVFSVMLSWGDSFSTFNDLMFDYFPAYNKFRSVTFALIIILFAMPLLGMLGLEKFLESNQDKETRKKLYIALGATGGLCLLVLLSAGMMDVSRLGENQLPAWFTNALHSDRRGIVRSDAFRSLAFIASVFIILFFDVRRRVSQIGFYAFLIFMVTIDLSIVDKRTLKKENYTSKRDNSFFAMTEADQVMLQDKSDFRVLNLQNPMNEARTSYYFQSLGGYHGAKIKRYQDLYDSCIFYDFNRLINDAQGGRLDFTKYHTLNMLNAKYIVYGDKAANIMLNSSANGNAWFAKELKTVKSANEEINNIKDLDTRSTGFVDVSKFQVKDQTYNIDSAATVRLTERKPPYLKYESNSTQDGLILFSEIYYPKGWHAFVDGKETEILRANYVLRALQVPAGKHAIEFKFEPKPYTVGNKITLASNWVVLLVVFGCLGWSLKKEE